jgi:hypothetical protein
VGKIYLDVVLLLFWTHFAFPLVVDTCVLQPLIATLGETASASQVFLKGPVVRACWCIVRVEPWVYPCANTFSAKSRSFNHCARTTEA